MRTQAPVRKRRACAVHDGLVGRRESAGGVGAGWTGKSPVARRRRARQSDGASRAPAPEVPCRLCGGVAALLRCAVRRGPVGIMARRGVCQPLPWSVLPASGGSAAARRVPRAGAAVAAGGEQPHARVPLATPTVHAGGPTSHGGGSLQAHNRTPAFACRTPNQPPAGMSRVRERGPSPCRERLPTSPGLYAAAPSLGRPGLGVSSCFL